MRKLILPLAMATATIASAADIEIHGDVNMDYASYFDSDFDPTNAGNQDINLALKAHLDENIAVVVKGTTHSTFVNENGELQESEVRHGLARSTAMGSDGPSSFTRRIGEMRMSSLMRVPSLCLFGMRRSRGFCNAKLSYL